MSSPSRAPSSRRGVRVVLLVLALIAGGVAVQRLTSTPETPDPATANAGGDPADIGVDPIDIEPGLGTDPGGPPLPPPPADGGVGDLDDLLAHERGTPVTEGARVAVGLTFRPGTSTRYRVMSVTRAADRGQETVSAQRQLEGWTVTVVRARKGGGWSVEAKQDWFKFQVIATTEMTFEYDSRSPDAGMVERYPALLRPLEAVRGTPYLVLLDAEGRVERVRGVDEARKRYQEALIRLNVPGAERHGPTEEELIEQFRTWFFPSVGGGELAADATRPATVRLNSGTRNWVTFKGGLAATHDDPGSFCVELLNTEAGSESFGAGGVLPDGRSVMGFRVPAEKDRGRASWVFDRDRGALRSARLHLQYYVQVVFAPTTGPEPQRFFQDMEQLITVDVLDEDDAGSSSDDPGGDAEDTGSIGNGEDRATESEDPAAGEESGKAR